MINNSIQEKDKTIINIYTPNIGAPQNRTHLQSSSGDADTEKRLVDQRRGQTERRACTYTHYQCKQRASGDLPCDTGSSTKCSVTNQRGGMGWKMGRVLRREGTCVYLWLIHVDVWQKPTQYYKAIVLQLKKTQTWQLNNMLLNNQWITEEIKEEI